MAFAVIKFGDKTLEIPDRRFNNCHCKSVELHDDANLLKCVHCGKFQSAYKWMRDNLGEIGILLHRQESIKADIQLKNRILEGLKRDERNTKARIRKLN